MTGAMLHRSRAFVRLAGTPVDVLTFDTRPDYPEVERRLRDRGELIEGMRLLNLWDWFRNNPVVGGAVDLKRHPLAPLPADPAHVPALRNGIELNRTRYAADAVTVVQIDHYREDGSLLGSDVRGADSRWVVLCDPAGRPIRSFGSAWAFYRYWLDILRNGDHSFLVIDSKTIANSMLTYRREDAVTMHIVHSSHLSGAARPIGPLRESRRRVFENLDDFDAVVVLTERQRQDIEQLLGRQPNLVVVPNGRDLSDAVAPLERPVGAGVVLASLTARKRLSHAVRAIASATFPDNPELSLDVYGDGEERQALEALRDDLGMTSNVRFHGYDPDARSRLAEASFLLLTSTSEGFPLVLIEAMAAGCIPIAYDVPYGPADIIKDGRDGLLVPPGDEAALADAVARLQSMSPRRVTRMRHNAQRAASAFSDLAVTRTWASAMRAADARKAASWARSHRVG